MKEIKQILFIGLVLGILVIPNFNSIQAAGPISPECRANLSKCTIDELRVWIAELQKQIAELQGKPTTWCHDFNRNLRIGDTGEEIDALWTALGKEVSRDTRETLSYDHEGMGLPSKFGEHTAAAVTEFQEKYKDEILTPLGLKHGTGFVGPATRKKLNALYGCGVPEKPYIKVLSPNGGEVWEKGTGGDPVIGTAYKIKWKTNITQPGLYVLIEYLKEGVGYNWKSIIGDISAERGEYSWIPMLSPGRYKIKIELYQYSHPSIAEDESDNYFSIVAP